MTEIEMEHLRHPVYYSLEVVSVYPTPKLQGGVAEWMLEGPYDGPEKWTEEEIHLVNEVLITKVDKPKHGRSYWYLWKHPASSIDSDKRPTYSIDTAVAGRTDYVHAIHSHDLSEMLRIWMAMQ